MRCPRLLLVTVLLLAAALPAQGAAAAPVPTSDGAVLRGLRERLFVLEHRLHALEAELMALTARLEALGEASDEESSAREDLRDNGRPGNGACGMPLPGAA